MKQEKLLTEINRINELMGNTIISEQATPNLLPRLLRLIKNYGDEFFEYVEKKLETETIIRRVRGVANNLVENDVKVLLKNISLEGIQKLAKNWFDNGLLFSRNVINTAMQKRISKILESKENYIKVCREIESGKDTFWGMYPSGQVPDYLVKTANEFANLFKKELDDIIEKDYPEIWKWVKEKGFASKTLREIEEMSLEAVELLYKKLNPNLVKAFVQKLTNSFKQIELSADEIQKLIAKYKNTTDAATRLQIEEIIDSSLIKLSQKNEEMFKFLSKWIDDNLKGDAALVNLKSKLKSTSNWKMAEIIAKTTKTDKRLLALSEAWEHSWHHLSQLLRELRTFFHFKGWLKGSKGFEEELKKNWPKIFDSTDDLVGVLRNWFLTGSKRGFPFKSNVNYKKIYDVAGTPTALLSYSAEVILNILKFHVIWATVEAFSEYVVHAFRGTYEDREGWLPDNLKDFVKDYKSTPKGSDYSDMAYNFLLNVARNFSDDFSSPYGGLVQIVPGYWDNLIKWVADVLFKGETEGFVKPENVKKAEEILTQKKEEVKQDIKDEIKKGESELKKDSSTVKTDTVPSVKTTFEPIQSDFDEFLKSRQETGTLRPDSSGVDSKGVEYYYSKKDKTFKEL